MLKTFQTCLKIISIQKDQNKRTSNSVPSTVIANLTKLKEVRIVFNKYFVNISSTIWSMIKFSRNKFNKFLPDIDITSFFIKPAHKTEIRNIILCLNHLKPVSPDSISTKILKFSNDISSQLTELFKISFSLGVFPSILKPSKMIVILKKECKLKCYFLM